MVKFMDGDFKFEINPFVEETTKQSAREHGGLKEIFFTLVLNVLFVKNFQLLIQNDYKYIFVNINECNVFLDEPQKEDGR